MHSKTMRALVGAGLVVGLGFFATAQAATVAVREFPVSVVEFDKTNHAGPWAAWTSTSQFVVVWQRPNCGGCTYALLMRRFDQSGVPVSEEVTLTDSTFIFSEQSTKIRMVDDAHFVVSWTDYDNASEVNNTAGLRFDLYAQVFNLDGSAASLRFPVNSPIDQRQIYPIILPVQGGKFGIAYRTNHAGADGSDIFARLFTLDGRPAGESMRVNATTVGADSRPAGDCNASGCLLAWTHNPAYDFSAPSLVMAQYVNPDLSPNGAEFQVSTPTDNPMGAAFPQVVMDARGAATVTWAVGNPAVSVLFSRYNPDHSLRRNGVVLNAATTVPASVAFPVTLGISNGVHGIAWSDDSATKSRLFFRDFTDGGGKVSTVTLQELPKAANEVVVRAAAVNAEGRAVVLWLPFPVADATTMTSLHGSIVTGLGVAPPAAPTQESPSQSAGTPAPSRLPKSPN